VSTHGDCDPTLLEAAHGAPVVFTLGRISGFEGSLARIKEVRVTRDGKPVADPPGIETKIEKDKLTLTTPQDGPERKDRVDITVLYRRPFERRSDGTVIPYGDVSTTCSAYIDHSSHLPSSTAAPTPLPTPTVVSAPPPPASQSTPTLDAYPTQVRPGETVSFTGEGFTPNCPVTKTFTPPGGTSFSIETTANAGGVVTATLDITPGQPAGAWTATATDQTTGSSATTTFTVVP